MAELEYTKQATPFKESPVQIPESKAAKGQYISPADPLVRNMQPVGFPQERVRGGQYISNADLISQVRETGHSFDPGLMAECYQGVSKSRKRR